MKGKVNFGAYDATAHKTYGKTYDVKGFPTLKGFLNGDAEEYNGGRTANALASWYSAKDGKFVTPKPEPPAPPMYDESSVS